MIYSILGIVAGVVLVGAVLFKPRLNVKVEKRKKGEKFVNFKVTEK